MIKSTEVQIRPSARTASATYWNISIFWQLWRKWKCPSDKASVSAISCTWPMSTVTHNIQIRCILL